MGLIVGVHMESALGRNKTRFDHVPAHCALSTDAEPDEEELATEGRLDVAACDKVEGWEDVCDADEATDDTMGPFPHVDALEVREVHLGVESVR